jgi:hypothetical protein
MIGKTKPLLVPSKNKISGLRAIKKKKRLYVLFLLTSRVPLPRVLVHRGYISHSGTTSVAVPFSFYCTFYREYQSSRGPLVYHQCPESVSFALLHTFTFSTLILKSAMSHKYHDISDKH